MEHETIEIIELLTQIKTGIALICIILVCQIFIDGILK